jgi:hypothetical protein
VLRDFCCCLLLYQVRRAHAAAAQLRLCLPRWWSSATCLQPPAAAALACCPPRLPCLMPPPLPFNPRLHRCQFPFDLERPPRPGTTKAFSTYDYVLLNSEYTDRSVWRCVVAVVLGRKGAELCGSEEVRVDQPTVAFGQAVASFWLETPQFAGPVCLPCIALVLRSD